MFHSVHTHDRKSMATLVATIALTTSFLVVGPSGANAQSSRRKVLSHMNNTGVSRLALSMVKPTASAGITVDTAALQGSSVGSAASPTKKLLVGSWLETVTFPPEFGRPPAKSLSSYHDDGTMSCTDQGNVTTDPALVFSACHGVWSHLDNRTFVITAFELISDLSGNLVGFLKFRGTYTVSTSGAEYEGTTLAEILDTDGNVLASVTVINGGQRIHVELP